MGETFFGLSSVFGIIFILVWIFMPFVILGIKNRLDTLIRLQRNNNKFLEKLIKLSFPEADKDSTNN